jgi:hypothetical protein
VKAAPGSVSAPALLRFVAITIRTPHFRGLFIQLLNKLRTPGNAAMCQIRTLNVLAYASGNASNTFAQTDRASCMC